MSRGSTGEPGRLHLGLPFWGHKPWAGRFYRSGARAKDHLRQYAEVFSTVEGNTTFYSLPSAESVERWRDSVPETFRFSFKLPRAITHELRLVDAEAATATFFERVAPLGPRLGPFLVQLPPSFGPAGLPALDRFLEACPREFRFAVEVRHPELFDEDGASRRLDEILHRRDAERCWMDTRALRSGPPSSSAVREALRKKPDVPVRVPAHETALSSQPMIRFVGHPETEITEPWIERWAGVLAQWIREGRSPFFMVHLPDNTAAPDLAAELHRAVHDKTPLDPLPDFPAERQAKEPQKGQLSLL